MNQGFDSRFLAGKDAAEDEVRDQQEDDQGEINEITGHIEAKDISNPNDPIGQNRSQQSDH